MTHKKIWGHAVSRIVVESISGRLEQEITADKNPTVQMKRVETRISKGPKLVTYFARFGSAKIR